MRLSQLSDADRLSHDVRRYRSMMEDATGYPGRKGFFEIGGRNFELPRATVEAILRAEWERIEAAAAELGVEVDE